jgi:hypothetical protein
MTKTGMTKDEGNLNDEAQTASRALGFRASCFVIVSPIVIRLARRSLAKAVHSSFS